MGFANLEKPFGSVVGRRVGNPDIDVYDVQPVIWRPIAIE